MSHSRKTRGPSSAGGTNESVAHKRQRNLRKINRVLSALDFPPFEKPGDYREGEVELVKVLSWSGNQFTTMVLFETLNPPNGTPGSLAMIVNTVQLPYQLPVKTIHISGVVCPVTIQDEHGIEWFVLTRQHRIVMQGWNEWPVDIPRGFNPEHPFPVGIPLQSWTSMPHFLNVGDVAISQVPLGIVGMKLAPLFESGLVEMSSFSVLGISPENNSVSRNLNLVSHLGLRTTSMEEVHKVRGTKTTRIEYHRVDEVLERWYELGASSQHTTTGLLFYKTMVWERR